ncbi:MAG: hypothetical protein PUB69_00415 [Desulfovibrionaceae bacterium]|nr:hypothetical protein [Desulfovibrionaceae bacterium]
MSRIAWRNFTGGEVSPNLSARYDLKKYGTALAACVNFLPNPIGDLERRPGLEYVAELDGDAVLIPFRFNTEPRNNYAILFGSGGIRIAHADGMLDGVRLDNPYTLEQARQISYAQTGDVLYLAHGQHPLRKITRSGLAEPYFWKIEEVAVNAALASPGKPRVVPIRGLKSESSLEEYAKHETFALSYKITAVDENGTETSAGEAGSALFRYPTDWVAGDAAEVRWNAVPNAAEYNVYRDSAGYFGYVGTVKADHVKAVLEGGTFSGDKLLSTLGRDFLPSTPCSWYIHRQGAFHTTTTIPEGGSGELYPSWLADDQSYRAVFNGSEWILFHSSALDEDLSDFTRGKWEDRTAPDGTHYPAGSGGNVCFSEYLTGGTEQECVYFLDENYEGDAAATPPEDWNPFAGGNYPRSVAFHQQRLVLGGTKKQPTTLFFSRVGDYENFRRSRPVRDDDALELTLASGSIDDLQWLVSFGNLLAGTSGAEYIIKSSGPALTPSDCSASAASFWGSGSLRPLVIGTSVLHNARAGGHIRDLYYSWETEGYNGNDLSLLAPHLSEEAEPLQWAFVRAPNPEIRLIRADGKALSLSYVREENVCAWSGLETEGQFRSVCELCGEERSEILYVVQREDADGRPLFFLERETDRFHARDGIENASFLDCSTRIELNDPADVVPCPEYLEKFRSVSVLADGSPADAAVVNGMLILPFKASNILIGLGYVSFAATMPAEADAENGTTLGRPRAFGSCVLRIRESVGGEARASRPGEIQKGDWESWKGGDYHSLPHLPAQWGRPVQPRSEDVDFVPAGGGMMEDAALCIRQALPLPFRISAIIANIIFQGA